MPKPFKKERRPTSRRPRESSSPSAEGIIIISLDALRPLFRSFFIWYAARFSGCFSFHEIVVTSLFRRNIYTCAPPILFPMGKRNFFGTHCDKGVPARDMLQALDGSYLRLLSCKHRSSRLLIRDAHVTMVPFRLSRFLK